MLLLKKGKPLNKSILKTAANLSQNKANLLMKHKNYYMFKIYLKERKVHSAQMSQMHVNFIPKEDS